MNKLIRCLPILLVLCLLACTPAMADRGDVVLSLESGFYDAPMPLEMSCDIKGAKIYYTTDGSIPDETDALYDGTITLMWTTNKDDPLSDITGITLGETWVPQQDFPSAHIIRAIAIYPNGDRSAVVSGTYFIGYDRQELYGDTAIMLLAIDPFDLFDYETGIYVTGKYYDEWVKEQTEAFEAWQGQGNYTQRGSDWERSVTVTFLPGDGSEGFTQDMGVRIKGGASRGNNQKSLRLIARADYGEKNVKFAIFPDNYRETDGKLLEKHKSFTLRNGGNDCDFGKIRDPYIQRLAEGMRFETAANLPVIAFINGEYWGLYTLNEEYTDNYIDYHYGIDNNNVITVKVGEVDDGEEEDIALFDEMLDFIAYSDMADPARYAEASEMLDMGSFADYCALQFYIGNEDGPFQNNNWQMWRVREPDDSSPYADGRWRMMLYDTDYSSGIYDGGETFNVDNLLPVLTGTDYQGRHPALLFNSLVQSDEFLAEFVNACCDIRNLYFAKGRTGEVLTQMSKWYQPYQADNLRRFGPQWVTWNPDNHFSNNLSNIRRYFDGRYNSFLDIVENAFELSDAVNVTLKIKGEGSVIINGRDEIPLTRTTSLKYFTEFGITVTAVPAEGMHFVGWEVSSSYGQVEDPTAETTTFTFSRRITLTAVFE